MLDLVGNPEDRFSQNEAQIICQTIRGKERHCGRVVRVLACGAEFESHLTEDWKASSDESEFYGWGRV